MATHAGVALELGITRPGAGAGGLKMMSPQMEAILIWCQCRTRNYKVNKSHNIGYVWHNFDSSWNIEKGIDRHKYKTHFVCEKTIPYEQHLEG